jgi:hypothetical protein
MKIKHIALAVALAMGSGAVLADTSSAIRGRITTPEGTAAAGTKIVITHLPSGTTRQVVTNESGSFIASGLRVGGPYTVVVDSDTYADETLNNIFLQLGENYQINEALKSESVERIAVTGATIAAVNTGSSSYFGADQIAKTPSFNRDIKDIVRNNPLAVVDGNNGAMSVAGSNPKFNSISVDGIEQNDAFGLNVNGYPTTRSPISLDAIDQITIDTSPFHAKDSGFQGAKVNAVTKSGTNKTFGSLFYETQNDGMAGTPKDSGVEKPLKFDETTYGATLGGAFVEDKLFYFISYDYYEADTPLDWGPAGSGASNETTATLADYQAIQRIARDIYNLDVGSWDASPVTDDEKLLLKLDWNLNDAHRAAFTYQFTKGNRTSNMTSGNGELRLSSHWYNRVEELNNYAFKLYSDWTPEFSTQFSLAYMDNPTTQKSFGEFGDVTIDRASSLGDIAMGSDLNRHSNELEKSTVLLGLDADYLYEDHSISFGYQFQKKDIYNLFLRNTKGVYVFSSIADFENRKANRIEYTNATSLNPVDGAAAFVRNEHALYVHDEWAVRDDLTLDMGVRYERLGSDDSPKDNPASLARTGYTNTENLDGIDIILPRFAFKWDATLDLTIRGGLGRFSGGQPTVWVSNSYSNPGVGVNTVVADSRNFAAALNGVNIVDIPQQLLTAVQTATGTTQETNLVDPNFNLPSDWRAQLAADYTFEIPGLGEDYVWTTEYLYKKERDSAFWVDASLTEADIAGTTADGGRLIYNDKDGANKDYMLTNATDSGRAKVISTALSKAYDNGVYFTASYTNQDITEAHSASSTTASSSYGLNININRNETLLGRSVYETEHRFVLNLGYDHEFVPGYNTSFNIFFERRSGKPITYYMDGADLDGNVTALGDPYGLLSPGTTGDSFLPYIPTMTDANVIWAPSYNGTTVIKTAEQNKAEFFSLIESMGLTQYQGTYLPKGVSTTPWVTTMDLSIRQEIPGFMEGHRGTFYVTVDNFLNLLDSSKGKVYGDDFGSIELVDFTIDPTTKKYIYGGSRTASSDGTRPAGALWDDFYGQESAWRLKVGVNYRF